MPKHIRIAGYIRESDEGLANSPTIESQAKAVRLYADKEGYEYLPEHEYMEALSAYEIPLDGRKRLLDLIAAAQRHEFDIVVVSEIRALGRRQAEVFVVYDLLYKCGVRIETVQEKFEDSAMGRLIFGMRAAFAEIERENTYMRTQRGERDRIANGNLPGYGKASYGYRFVDSERETSARYELNTVTVFVDEEGKSWSEAEVIRFMFESMANGMSLLRLARLLTQMGVPLPTRRGNYWRTTSILRMLRNPFYKGEAVIYRFKKIDAKSTRGEREGKEIKRLVARDEDERIILPVGTVPPIVSVDMWDVVQERLDTNKQESLRNNQGRNETFGIVRAGYAKCGICGRNMKVKHHNNYRKPEYYCRVNTGHQDLFNRHNVYVLVHVLDRMVKEKIREIVMHPCTVRERVQELRRELKKLTARPEVEAHIADIDSQTSNLFELAKGASNLSTINNLTVMLKDLEKQRRDAERLLSRAEEQEGEEEILEAEIVRFEKWADEVRPHLGDPCYLETASYEELRLAVRIIGIQCVIRPLSMEDGCYDIQVRPPKIVSHMTNRVRALAGGYGVRGN